MKYIFLLPLLLSLVLAQDANLTCDNGFFSKAKFAAWNVTRPNYLSAPAISNNLTFCKMYNNVSSCCSRDTDDQIAALYNNYKASVAMISSKRIKRIKDTFENYTNIPISDKIPNSRELKAAIKSVVKDIKERWVDLNKDLVACAKGAMNLTVGLLCTGCAPKNDSIHRGNKLGLAKKACVALAGACYRLMENFTNVSSSSVDDAMNLTDSITTYIGEEIPVNSTDNSSSIFGDIPSDANATARLLSPKEKEIADKIKELINKKADNTINNSYVEKLCNNTINSTFKNASCFLCPANSTNSKCQIPLYLVLSNETESIEFNKKSEWSYTAANISIQISFKSKSYNLTWSFLFTQKKNNDDLFKFLLLSNVNPQVKIARLAQTERVILQKVDSFLKLYRKTKGDKVLAPKDDIKSLYNNSRVVKCAIDVLESACIDASKSLFETVEAFDFDLRFKNESNGTVAGLALNKNYTDSIEKCYESKDLFPILSITGSCSNLNCLVCLDSNCFDINFNFTKVPDSEKKDANRSSAQEQFKKDKRNSPRTGKRVPEFVDLPPIDYLTSFKFVAPCSNAEECAIWFCSRFLKGPFARIEKIYNPQDGASELDENVSYNFSATSNASNASDSIPANNNVTARILIDEADYEIGAGYGVDFNAVAGQSAAELSVTIDGVSQSSNSTLPDTNTPGGSFGERVRIVVGLMAVALGLFLN